MEKNIYMKPRHHCAPFGNITFDTGKILINTKKSIRTKDTNVDHYDTETGTLSNEHTSRRKNTLSPLYLRC